jgi:hypothetical protein
MKLDRMSITQLMAEALEAPTAEPLNGAADAAADRPFSRAGCSHSWMDSVDAAFDGGRPPRRVPSAAPRSRRPVVHPFPRSRTLDVLLPAATAHHMGTEASERWGAPAVNPKQGREAWVLVCPPDDVGEPYGGVRVRWSDPGPATAQVLEVAWDPARGGSADAVLGTLNSLLGWPLLR